MNELVVSPFRELRIAGALVIVGLAVIIASLMWKAPLSFLVFAGIGVTLTAVGVLVYLYSIVSSPATHQ